MLIVVARVFAVIFAVLVLSKSFLSYREKKESLTMTMFWSVTWLVICSLAFYPKLIDMILGSPKADGGSGTILGIGLIFLYFVIYRIYIKADRLEKRLSRLIRDMALNSHRE